MMMMMKYDVGSRHILRIKTIDIFIIRVKINDIGMDCQPLKK